MEPEKTLNHQGNVEKEKENKAGGIMSSDYKLHCNAVITKAA